MKTIEIYNFVNNQFNKGFNENLIFNDLLLLGVSEQYANIFLDEIISDRMQKGERTL